MGLHDDIRQHLQENMVLPYLSRGVKTLHVEARQVGDEMHLDNRYPAICSVLDGRKFLDENGLRIAGRVGPKQSPTVEWWFERTSPPQEA